MNMNSLMEQGGYKLSLTKQDEQTIAEYARNVDIMDANQVLFYGSESQKKIAEFSDQTLNSIKTKDLGEISNQLTSLVTQLGKVDDEPKGFIRKLFKSAESSIKTIKANYESAAKNVEKITRELENHQVILMQDINMFQQMYEINLSYLKELTMYIMAGKQALENARNTTALELKSKAETSGQPEDAQAYNDFNSMCERFEKKIYDLELTRNQAIQMAPQIRLLQGNDQALVEKIQTVVVNTIPIWKNQMVISLGLAHSQQAMQAQRAVTDATNSMMQKNAEMLKQASIGVATEMERGVIDLETLKKTNQSLIETLTEIKQIQDKGREQRSLAEYELQSIENELRNKLLSLKA